MHSRGQSERNYVATCAQVVACLIIAVTGLSGVAADDPVYYVKRDTWQETLRVSREALVKYEAEEAQKARPDGDESKQP